MAASDSTVRRTKKGKKPSPSPQKPKMQNGLSPIPPSKPLVRRKAKKASSRCASFSLLNFVARAISWYMLYTVLFQCPSEPTEDTTALCHASYHVKTALKPHVQPYYDTYLAPHVDQYAPYAIKANEDYIQPVYQKATTIYNEHGQQYVAQGREVVGSQYAKYLKPHVSKAEEKAHVLYKDYLSPHVETGTEIWIASKPRVIAAQQQAQKVWNEKLVPAYHASLPYVVRAYEQGKHVMRVVVTPVVKDGGEKVVGWGKGLWSDVVQPQVGRIGERLGGSNGKEWVSKKFEF